MRQMASHFLLSAKARSLSIATVLRMTDAQAETMFAAIRWTETDGRAVCPHCGCGITYQCRRPSGALRFRCKACRKDFSLTSGTLFAFHKMPLQTYLAAIVIFCNEVKGKSALALSRDFDVQYKTAWVLSHKLREAMATEVKGRANLDVRLEQPQRGVDRVDVVDKLAKSGLRLSQRVRDLLTAADEAGYDVLMFHAGILPPIPNQSIWRMVAGAT